MTALSRFRPLARRRSRAGVGARGFTLVELIATFVVLAVLAAVGTFAYRLFARDGDAAEAKERLASTVALELAYARSHGAYTADGTDLPAVADSATVTSAVSSSTDVVSAALGPDGALGLAVLDASGKCHYQHLAPLLTGGDVTTPAPAAAMGDGETCSGADALPAES